MSISRQDRQSLPAVTRVLSRLCTASLWIAGFGLVLMTAFVAWQVYCRYVLNNSPSWTEPGAVMVMSWFIFLGAAVGVRENFHLGFDVLLYILPKGSKAALRTISDLVVGTFGVGMIYYGSQLVVLTWASTLPSLGLPGSFDYLPVVVGGVLVVLFSVERIALRWSGVDIDSDVNFDEVPAIVATKEG